MPDARNPATQTTTFVHGIARLLIVPAGQSCHPCRSREKPPPKAAGAETQRSRRARRPEGGNSREEQVMHFRTLVLAAAAVALSGTAQAQVLRMGGGPSGGAWHPAWSAGTQLLNQELGDKYK